MTVLALTACTETMSPPPQAEEEVIEPSDTETTSAEIADNSTLSNTDLGRVCRAAVAELNGRDPASMQVKDNAAGIVRVEYRRPDDNKLWKNDCRVEGDKLIWRGVDAFGHGSGPGRWREDPMDEVITFALDGSNVTINMTFSDGSSGSETYTIN